MFHTIHKTRLIFDTINHVAAAAAHLARGVRLVDGRAPRLGERAFRPLPRDAGGGGGPFEVLEGARAGRGAGRRRAIDGLGVQGGAGGAVCLPRQRTPGEAAFAAWRSAFAWAGPPPAFIDLIGDGDDGKGKGEA